MITLTINPHSCPETVQFQQPLVTIGSGSADLILPAESLQNCHIKIIEENERFLIVNCANDPFATLNFLPFGKKILHNQDLLKIGNTEILFEGKLAPIIETVSPTHQEESVPAIPAETNSIDIDALFREVESLDEEEPLEIPPAQEPVAQYSSPMELPPSETPEMKQEIPVLDVSEFYGENLENKPTSDERTAKESSEGEAVAESSFSGWRIYLAFFIVAVTIASIFAAAIFVSVIDTSDAEEISAAEAVSDVAMALAYAQVHHIKPQKQNWFDPEFLKNNLASVLSSEFPAFAHIDHQGQLSNCHYILRIYTSSDLSQFLVMAQPEPSLLQWLIPKASIMVDSRAMEMRIINDLKALNRLLVNPNTLDGSNAVEISNLVKQGELIPLKLLAAQEGNQGFSPPKALALIRPGAEDLIYNAPRYHHFGESILNRSVQLLQMVGNSHDILRLQEEIDELANFPNIVLYSSQGIQKAIKAQKALAALAPMSKYFTAYLNYNAAGLIASSHLVLSADPTGLLSTPSMMTNYNEIENRSQLPEILTDDSLTAMNISTSLSKETISQEIHQASIAAERQAVLNELSESLIELINRNTEMALDDFREQFSLQFMEYEKIDNEYRKKMERN